MKTAVVFSGNLRTFFMPLRENPSIRVCDVLLNNVVTSTNADVYISTDTENFYLDGVQYFYVKDKLEETKILETYNFDSMRFHNKIEFIEYEDAYKLLKPKLENFFGNSLKSLIINEPYDVTKDSKYEFLKRNTNAGSIPEFLISQHRKSFLAYDEICNYESINGKYDVIIKSRFDNVIVPNINLAAYNFNSVDLYVPFIKGPVYFDWSAIGNRKAMHHYLTMYNKLGNTLAAGESWLYSCSRCNYSLVDEKSHKNLIAIPACPRCGKNDCIVAENVTMASEHHVCHMVRTENLKCAVALNQTHIYRYNDSSNPLDLDFIKSMNLGSVKLRSYKMEGITEHSI